MCKNLRWSKIPYAGETELPKGIEPNAYSWPLYYLKRDECGKFLYLNGQKIKFDITHPSKIDFYDQLEQVKETLGNLTEEQIDKAKYWGAGPATKQWTPIIDKLIDTYSVLDAPQENPVHAARILGAVQAGINDTFVVTWYYKYRYGIARPNQLDRNLKTIICTPKFPAYPSGHAAISGCAEVILSYFFPKEDEKLHLIAEENAHSRVYGGVHYPVDGVEGLKIGRQIGKIIVAKLRSQYDSECNEIDPYISEYLDADIIPTNYKEQIIPYPRSTPCDSLTI